MTDHNPPLGIWEGIVPEPEDFAREYEATLDEDALLPTQDGDTQPNATEYDCGYATIAGACIHANTDHCAGCPYRVAIGDVAP